MKLSTATVALFALGGAVIGVGFLGARLQLGGDGFAGALANAQRPAKQEPSKPRSHAVAATPASAATEPAPVTPESLPATPRFRQTNTYNGNVVYVPEGCHGAYDVILHFHGAHTYVRDLVEKAGIAAVIVVYNAGNGAERYAQAFQAGGMLSSLLRQVDVAVAPLCGADAKPRRIALSAWSAGYGAVQKLVTHPEDRDRVDAVLLADGLHAGFTDRWKRQFAPNALQAFRDLGELAKTDQKLLAITHSTIATDGYASTTECSRLLLQQLDVPSVGPFVSGKSGSFSIEGSAGDDKEAHIAQFHHMDTTLFSKLRSRW